MNKSENETQQQPRWMVSILSPIAKELGISDGTAGKTMSITAMIAIYLLV